MSFEISATRFIRQKPGQSRVATVIRDKRQHQLHSDFTNFLPELHTLNDRPGLPSLGQLFDPEAKTIFRLPTSTEKDQRFHEGQVVGNFKFVRFLGEGGAGQTWLVEYKGEKKALKINLDCPWASDTYKQEAEALAHLGGGGVVSFFGQGVSSEGPYLLMEYIEGPTLAQKIEDDGVAAKGAFILGALNLFAEICRAVKEGVHQKGWVHRDIKPGNLMLVEGGLSIKIIDFNLSQPSDNYDVDFCFGGLGTYQYASPEQILGEKPDIRGDIYSLGVTLYKMLTGKRPFPDESLRKKMSVLKIEGMPGFIIDFLARMTDPAIEKRYQNLDEVLIALDRVRAELTAWAKQLDFSFLK